MRNKIDWLNRSLEFTVVLAGILIAFQLNRCSENTTQNELIGNHLEYIELECQENEKKLDLFGKQIEDQIKHCDSLLLEITKGKSPLRIRNLSTRLLDMRNAELSSNAYEVLTQSGDIRFLKDYEVKRQIISMYDSFKKVDNINQSNQNLYDSHFYPYLKSNFDLVSWNSFETKSKQDEKSYYSQEFANTISTYRYLLIAKLRIYSKEKETIKEYLKN